MTFVSPNFAFITVLFALGAGLAVALLIASKRQREQNWSELVGELHPLDFDVLSKVALDYLNPQPGQRAVEIGKIWEQVGGLEGLDKMCANAKVMLALAAYAQRWNFEEGVIVTERMRRDALQLRSAVRRVQLGLLPYRVFRSFGLQLPFHLHEAVSAYYLMHQRLLALYQTSHAGLYPALAATM